MPELPEVEVTRQGITSLLGGRRITGVAIREPRLRWRVPDTLRDLTGNTIRRIRRRGKYLLFDCDTGCIIVHLGMSGSLRVLASDAPAGKHDHVDLVFGQRLLRLRDPRRFGAVLWTTRPAEEHSLLRNLGLEPLSRDLDGPRLHALTRNRRTAIKQLLMDAQHIVGIGNIYANEILFHAGIHPQTRANRLSLERCTRLTAAIKSTLRAAIRAGGSSLRDFVGCNGEPGHFQQHYWVYGRAGQPCRRCATPVRHTVQGQRATFYCSACQR